MVVRVWGSSVGVKIGGSSVQGDAGTDGGRMAASLAHDGDASCDNTVGLARHPRSLLTAPTSWPYCCTSPAGVHAAVAPQTLATAPRGDREQTAPIILNAQFG